MLQFKKYSNGKFEIAIIQFLKKHSKIDIITTINLNIIYLLHNGITSLFNLVSLIKKAIINIVKYFKIKLIKPEKM